MNTIAARAPARTGLVQRLGRAAWIQSPGFDVFLLIFAPLLTLPVVVGMYFSIPFLAITCGLTLAFAHYWSTLAFFFWDENRDYLRSRWVAFYVGPVLIVLAVVLLYGLQVPFALQVLVFFWNTWHVSRQNCGILSIYRQRAGVQDPAQRSAANDAILAVSLFLSLWNIDTHAEVVGLFGLLAGSLLASIKVLSALIAMACMARLAWALWRRREPVGVPEALFLLTALAFFHPYLVIRDSGMATYAMLLPHYVQYMALVWLLHRRKFPRDATAGAPRALIGLSSRLWLLVPVLIAVGLGFTLLREGANAIGFERGFQGLFLAIVLMHFYLDGLIWSFKRPHVRKTIGSVLLRAPEAGS